MNNYELERLWELGKGVGCVMLNLFVSQNKKEEDFLCMIEEAMY